MSTKLDAKRKLHQHGQNGNWRMKGLLLAALPGTGVSKEDVAEAWPDPGKKGDYRFLSGRSDHRTADAESSRRVIAEPGEERHRILSDYAGDVTRELGDDGTVGAELDAAVKRTLLGSSTFEEVDTLFREQLHETVMEGAEKRKFARDASNVLNASTRSGDITIASDETYADRNSEGSEIRDDGEDYATISWDCTKLTKGSRVTDEMVDHSMVDLIERNIQKTGAAVENSINREFLNNLLTNANGNYDAGGSGLGVPALNGGVGVVDNEDFMADSFVSHPEFRTALFDDSNLVYANQSGGDTELRQREVARIMGVDHYAASGGTYDGSAETWAYGATGEKGAVVYDSDHVHTILYSANGSGIEVKDYDDPIRDLTGVNARVWADADYSQQRAGASVQHS